MNCEKVKSKIVDYYDNLLGSIETEEITEHLNSCIKCKAEYEHYKKIFIQIDKIPELVPDEKLLHNFEDMVKNFPVLKPAEIIYKTESNLMQKSLALLIKYIHGRIAVPLPVVTIIIILFTVLGYFYLVNRPESIQIHSQKTQLDMQNDSSSRKVLKNREEVKKEKAKNYQSTFVRIDRINEKRDLSQLKPGFDNIMSLPVIEVVN